ncbi:MAG: AAA family ATPase [Promethearchaeota archaeon]
MTWIKKISMSGFKSFGDRTVTIKLSSGFTCIVGPNGAGKSNIIDALCFALGRLSKKTMRAKSLEDLIFAGSKGKPPANRASVTIYFDNSDDIFPGGKDTDFTITRTIKRGGGGGYKMNGKKATRQQILNALAAANIDPDGGNQFVLQGKIVELTHMNPISRREFIEDLVGLQKYDEMRDATLKELEKAERDLGQFEAIFKEVSAQLKKVEKEKNDALAWKELDEKINFYNAQLIALKINKLQKEEEELERKIEESTKIIEELEEKINHQEELLKQETLIMENIQKTISEKEKERESISEKITQLKTELSSNQTELNLAKKTVEKLEQDKKYLESLQMTLEEGQTYDSLIEETNKNITELENSINDAKKEIDKRQQNQTELDNKIKERDEEKSNYKAEISNIKQQISSNKARIKVLRQEIKKNELKKKRLEEELKKLQGDAESIEDAIQQTKEQELLVRKKIEELNKKIQEENQKQKDLENQIGEIQEQKSNINIRISELQSTLSSLNTEIKMNKENIESLIKKKQSLERKISELSGGKDVEEVLKNLNDNKKKLIEEINSLKEKAKNEESTFRKNEQDLELLKMKQSAIINELNDNNSKIANIKTELKIFNKELGTLEREKKNIELKINTLNSKLIKYEDEINNLSSRKEILINRLKDLNKEREQILKKIEEAEIEYNESTEEISGILATLDMLTQGINISVEQVKGSIQQSNAEAIENAAEDFRKFILDIIDIMKTLESIDLKSDNNADMMATLNSILQTLTMFTDNADESIEQLISRVQESSDIAIQESTSEIDSLIQDLIEIIENIHLSLRRLTMSKSQELYKNLDDISESIKSQENDLNQLEKKLTEITLQKKHDDEELRLSETKLNEINKRLNELNEKIQNNDNELNSRSKIVNNKKNELEQINKQINEYKELKSNYWENISKIQQDIDKNQKELDNIQEKLKDLLNIQGIYENIDEISQNIENIKKIIDDKKKIIIQTENNIEKVKKERDELDNKIKDLKNEKEKFWEITENLRNEIEKENKNLEEILDRLRALQNVKRIISNIEELTKENEESEKLIEISNKEIEDLNKQVDSIQINVDKVQKIIDDLRNEKEKELEAQKAAQKLLNSLNKDLQKTQNKLNELNKNKERQQQILNISEEIVDMKKKIDEIVLKIENIEENIRVESEKKESKQEEINKLIQEKDQSWRQQKEYQKILTDLKADLSLEKSKINNFESKKIMCSDQIETLYEKSKDYGTLPVVTDELSEAGLQSDIEIATKKKRALEPVNLKAIEEYDIVKERFDEIDMRRQTIQRERKAILDKIEQIELRKTRDFMKAYHGINREFSRVFQKLSPGGSAKMILERPDKPFEGGILIEARPRGKKISSLEILSGGEKTLVALSFIFAVQEFFPAPFYIMDEIDAALDGPNVHRVSMVIKEFSRQAQFIVISHREENIVNADRIYGVTMQQSGITDVFSVNLQEEAKKLLELEENAKVEEN